MKIQMNGFAGALTIALTALFTTAALAQEASLRRAPEPRDKVPLITVTGDSEVSATPDRAKVRLGATAQMPEAAAAQSNVNSAVQKTLEAIEKIGIPKNAIRTTGLTLVSVYAPQRSVSAEAPRVVAYRAGNTIEVTVDDLKLLGPVIDAGVGSGANRLDGVSFALKNDLPERTQALAAAVEEARTKAEAIARALGAKLGKVVEVNESGVHVLAREQNFAGVRTMAAEAVSTPVEPGEVRVRASVTAVYELDNR
jgi:hypothetical protein